MYYKTVCVCFNIEDTTMKKLIKMYGLKMVMEQTKAGTKCKRCLPRMYKIEEEIKKGL